MFPASLSMLLLVVFLAIRQLVAQPEGPPPRPSNVRYVKKGVDKFIYWQYTSQWKANGFTFSVKALDKQSEWEDLSPAETTGNLLHAIIPPWKMNMNNGLLRACKGKDNGEVCSSWVGFEGPPIKITNENEVFQLYAPTTLQGLPMAPDNLQLVSYNGLWITWSYPPESRTGVFFLIRNLKNPYSPLEYFKTKEGVKCAQVEATMKSVLLKACNNRGCSDTVPAKGPIKIDKNTPQGWHYHKTKLCIESEIAAPTQDPSQGKYAHMLAGMDCVLAPRFLEDDS